MQLLEEIEQRLNALEEEVCVLREQVASLSPKEMPIARDATNPCEANQAPLDAGAEEAYQKIIAGEAPGIDNLRALLAVHGIHPGNEIVREVIAAMGDQEEEP